MNKNKRVLLIQKILDEYFPNPKVPLKHTNLFTLAVAVILSARTTDKKVNEVTKILFKKAKNPSQMLKFSQKELQKIIHPIGFYKTKAKAILKLSKILEEKYSSKLPSSLEELESLPGIGHKTASVILSQGFKKSAFPVDTHIFRCAKRWKLSDGSSIKKTEEDLKKIFLKKDWNKVHLQIIYFGKEYCKARGHKSNLCPICSIIK
jgi:endonuclease III